MRNNSKRLTALCLSALLLGIQLTGCTANPEPVTEPTSVTIPEQEPTTEPAPTAPVSNEPAVTVPIETAPPETRPPMPDYPASETSEMKLEADETWFVSNSFHSDTSVTMLQNGQVVTRGHIDDGYDGFFLASVDENGKTLTQYFDKETGHSFKLNHPASDLSINGDYFGCHDENWDWHYYNRFTGEPRSMSRDSFLAQPRDVIINGGRRCHVSGSNCELYDADGVLLKSGNEYFYYYTDDVQFGYNLDTYENFISIKGNPKTDCSIHFVRGWAGGIVIPTDEDTLEFYDEKGTLQDTVKLESIQDSYTWYDSPSGFADETAALLLLRESSLYTLSGEKEYPCSLGPNKNLHFKINTPIKTDHGNYYVIRHYHKNALNQMMAQYDILDDEGNLVLAGLDDVSQTICLTSQGEKTATNCFSARKGFTYGLMDLEGKWIWSESVFNTNSDEPVLYF